MTQPTFRSCLIFDPTRGEYCDGNIRYMVIRHGVLMGVIADLPGAMRPQALEATRSAAPAVARCGPVGRPASDSLATRHRTNQPQPGWDLRCLARVDEDLELTLDNSPSPGRQPFFSPCLRAGPRHADSSGGADTERARCGCDNYLRRYQRCLLPFHSQPRSPARRSSGSTVSIKYGNSCL
jgi:hypothetical protein